MKISGKIGLIIPTDSKTESGVKYFNADNSVDDIFNYISDNVHSIKDMLSVKLSLRFDDISNTDDESDLEIAESYIENNDNSTDLTYSIPRRLAFTQRFQDRIKYDIPNIIESVYADCKVVNSSWIDNGDDDYISLTITVEFENSKDSASYSKHLDENVKYAIDDIIDYYSK